MADLAVWQRTIVDEKGDVIPGAEVSVRSYPGGSLITLYEGPDGTQVKGNPFSTGADGFARFWAESQRAEIIAHGAGSTIRWIVDLLNADEVIGDAISEATAAAAVAVGEAEAAADRAEAARDAAQLNAGVYEDTTAGLAATTDGDYFSVPGAADDYLILYRNDNGSADEINRVPSLEAVDTLVGVATQSLDWDAIDRSGFYRSGDNPGETVGAPEGLGFLGLLNIYKGNRRHQLAFRTSLSDPQMWVRAYYAPSGWGDWKELAFKDDVNEVREELDRDSQTLNRGRNFPLRPMVRGGSLSDPSTTLNNALLGVSIIGPADHMAGKYWRLSYFQNGATLAGLTHNGIRIEEYDAATYESVGDGISIHTPQDTPADYDRAAGGIQTFTVTPAERPSMRFVVTLDVDELPPSGTPVAASQEAIQPSWSWIIDPSCYLPVPEANAATDTGGMQVSYSTSTGILMVASRSGGGWVRYTFRPIGHNDCPNPWRVEITQDDDPSTAVWETVYQMASEHFGVMHVEAVNNGDGGNRIATGGNHGSDGGSGGSQTARNILYRVMADGRELTEDFSGYCDRLDVVVVNEVMGWNTITFPRYVLRQSYQCQFAAGGVLTVQAKMTALEDVVVWRDRFQGDTGWSDTVIYLDGPGGRVPVSPPMDSGASSANPNAWGGVLKSDDMQMAFWLDRTYGIASGEHVDDNEPLVLITGKFYVPAINEAPYPLAAGESYSWRGGYSISAPPTVADSDIDSYFVLTRGGERALATVYPDGQTDA